MPPTTPRIGQGERSPEEVTRDASPSEPAAASEPRLLERYELLFPLARGGMGQIHVARLRGAQGFDRLVAVKVLSGVGGDHEQRVAFFQEARLSARIHHPNVVSTLDFGEHQGVPFLVMEFVRGVSLAELLKASSPGDLDPYLVAWLMSRVALGLHAAHELTDDAGRAVGVVHRDVSPQNVLISYEGRVCIADFGIAKLIGGEATSGDALKGKLAYMSPEQVEARPLDRRSDIFSFGVVFHEALTGRRLFAASSPVDTISRIVRVEPSDPRALNHAVPARVGAVAMRCLDKRPEQRFDTAAQVAEALRDALRHDGRAIDELDVAALLQARFAGRRADLEERLRSHGRSSDGVAFSRSESSEATAETAIATTREAPTRQRTSKRGARIALVASSLAVVASGVAFVQSSNAPERLAPGAFRTAPPSTSEVAPSSPPPSEPASSASKAPDAGGPAPSATPAAPRVAAPRQHVVPALPKAPSSSPTNEGDKPFNRL